MMETSEMRFTRANEARSLNQLISPSTMDVHDESASIPRPCRWARFELMG